MNDDIKQPSDRGELMKLASVHTEPDVLLLLVSHSLKVTKGLCYWRVSIQASELEKESKADFGSASKVDSLGI